MRKLIAHRGDDATHALPLQDLHDTARSTLNRKTFPTSNDFSHHTTGQFVKKCNARATEPSLSRGPPRASPACMSANCGCPRIAPSKPVRVGYLNGIALTVIVTQAPKLFGVSVRADGVLQGSLAFVQAVAAGQTRWPALAIGAACLATIFGLRTVAPKVPGIFMRSWVARRECRATMT